MLILKTNPKDTIRIGDNIAIKILSCRRGDVRLGIETPNGVPVRRDQPAKQIVNQTKEGDL